jgi:hypothetical protein
VNVRITRMAKDGLIDRIDYSIAAVDGGGFTGKPANVS